MDLCKNKQRPRNMITKHQNPKYYPEVLLYLKYTPTLKYRYLKYTILTIFVSGNFLNFQKKLSISEKFYGKNVH